MKYKFTDETKEVDGHVLHRIVATCCLPSPDTKRNTRWVDRKEGEPPR